MRSMPEIDNVCDFGTVPRENLGEIFIGPKSSGGAQRNKPRGGSKPTNKKNARSARAGAMVTAASRAMNSRNVRAAVGSIKMSSCAAKLAAAIADPFSEEARGACFPLYPAPDSHKPTPFSRVEGAIGTAGVGFIAINPSVANNVPSFYVTGATFTGSRTSILTAASTLATGVVSGTHNGPYAAESFIRTDAEPEPLISGRVVAVGVRVTYTGTVLNQSGLAVLLQHPTHGNLSGATSTQLQSFSESDICPFTRKPCTLALAPCGVNEAAYPGPTESTNVRTLYPWNPDGRFHSAYEAPGAPAYANVVTIDSVAVSCAAPMAIIMLSGVAGSTFHVDIIYHMEYTGPLTAAASTPNSVDVSSVYAILTAAGQLSTRKMAHPGSSNWKLLMDGVRAAMGSPVSLSASGLVRSVARMVL